MGDITYPQIRTQLEGRTATGEFLAIEQRHGLPGRKFTTAKTISEEREIIQRMQAGKSPCFHESRQ